MSVPAPPSRTASRVPRRFALALAALALSLAACGRLSSEDPGAGDDGSGPAVVEPTGGGSAPGSAGGGAPGSTGGSGGGGAADCPTEPPSDAGPDTPVCTQVPPGGGTDPGEVPDPVPSPVEPRPGMANVHVIGWEDATVGDDDRTVAIAYWSGVEPCSVLDHVDVAYGDDSITITLYEGNDPDAGDVACPEIAMYKSVTVTLDQDVAGRTIVDGAGDPA